MAGPDWVYYALAAAIGAAALPLLWWALLHDRPRGRRRCPKCWYNMAGARGLTCPECGRAVTSDRQLVRTRRRWGAAAGACAMLAGALVLAVMPRAQREGWLWWAPTEALLRVRGTMGTATPAPVGDALFRRAWSEDLTESQWRRVIPIVMGLEAMRVRWPAEGPVYIPRTSVFTNAVGGVGRTITLQPPAIDMGPEGRWIEGGAGLSYERFWSDNAIRIVQPPPENGAMWWQARVTDGDRVLFAGEVTRPIVRSGGIDDLLTPVAGASIDAAMTGQLKPRLMKQPTSGRPGLVIARPGGPEFSGVTLGLVAEFRRGDVVVAQARAWIRPVPGEVGPIEPLYVFGDAQAVLDADPNDPAWTVRIRGDGEIALRDSSATRYWAGEFTLPLKALYR